jgi:4-hydroxy-4-methyl-2-oxoglutarate aldolase
MDRLGAMDYRIKPLVPSLHLCGPALTVRTRPGDNLMVWKAVDIAQSGDVLVIATYDHSTVSTFGENVVKAAKTKGSSATDFAATSVASAPRGCRRLRSVLYHRAPAKTDRVRSAERSVAVGSRSNLEI